MAKNSNLLTIRKALNKKNTLIGEINDLKTKIRENNMIRTESIERDITKRVVSTSTSATVDVVALYEQLFAKTEKLIELKTKLAVVNAGGRSQNWNSTAYYKIERIAELKALISFTQSLGHVDPYVDTQIVSLTDTAYERKIVETTFQFTNAQLEEKVAMLKAQLEEEFDDLEEFNASRRLEIEL